MKGYIQVLAHALATVASAYPQHPQNGGGNHGSGNHGSAGAMPGMPGMSGHAPNAAMITGAAPVSVKTIQPAFRTPGSTRVEVKYGPYTMASANDTTLMKMPGMEDEGGVVDVNWKLNAYKPCSDCMLKYASADLHYTDGKPANLDTGAWLHHMTLSVNGPGRADAACPDTWKDGERILVVHNDRNSTYYGLHGEDAYGYHLKPADKLTMVLELKNELNIPKQVYFTVTFEFTPGRPAGAKDVRPLWLDAQACGAASSEISPPTDKKVFSVSSRDWVAPFSGTLLTTVGHLHDGGTALDITLNGRRVCTSRAVYGGDAAYRATPEAVRLGAQDIPHISRYTACHGFGAVRRGDRLALTASYDFENWRPGTGTSGHPVGVMGIALIVLGVE